MIIRCGRGMCYDTETKHLHLELYDDGYFAGPGEKIGDYTFHLVQKSWWSAFWQRVLSGGQAVQYEHPIDYPTTATAVAILKFLGSVSKNLEFTVVGSTLNPTSYRDRPELFVTDKQDNAAGPFDFGEMAYHIWQRKPAVHKAAIEQDFRSQGLSF